MTNFSDELTAKRAAINEARNSKEQTIPAEQAILIFEANIAKVRKEINRLKGKIIDDTTPTDDSERSAKYEEPIQFR